MTPEPVDSETQTPDDPLKMSDGREEREEREKRREIEKKIDRSDRVGEEPDDYEPERPDSKSSETPVAAAPAAQASPTGVEAAPEATVAVPVEAAPQPDPAAIEAANKAVLRESGKRTRRSFVIAAAAAAVAYTGYSWIDKSEMVGRQQKPLRAAFNANAKIAREVFNERGIAPTYSKDKAVADLRFNGPYGLRQELMLDSWRLKLVGVAKPEQYKQFVPDVTAWEYKEVDFEQPKATHADDSKGPAEKPAVWKRALNADGTPMRGQEEAGDSDSDLDPFTPGLLLTLDDIKALPHHEFVTEFKCIEGWSEIVHWGGYRLADLIAAYPPARNAKGEYPKYVYMETPYGDYYCGYNMSACTHPQSLLTTEMSGAPLSQLHGAPIRLHMPIKYGYKQIKRIALIAYTDKQPDDYWTKLGYDWYAGL
ncbi:molybdopterin-dependent oxidoreductase [Granulicella aggregans]|uniref:molybdopterin-dependent oxidoreductase n=1 Tax=Granulicella aggregans TaxID=474949 RepID=UPI0021E0AF91|nr:molybdopterin-dependent oxidoreductase [Granulicella aggregans]